MAVHEPVRHQPQAFGKKTLAESAVCFSVALGALAAAALVMQWLMGVLS